MRSPFDFLADLPNPRRFLPAVAANEPIFFKPEMMALPTSLASCTKAFLAPLARLRRKDRAPLPAILARDTAALAA